MDYSFSTSNSAEAITLFKAHSYKWALVEIKKLLKYEEASPVVLESFPILNEPHVLAYREYLLTALDSILKHYEVDT